MKKLKKYRYCLGLTIVVILMGMTACGPKETELSFETIEKGDWAGYGDLETVSVLETQVILVTNPQEIAQLKGLVSQEALDQLAELDFGQYFAIAVFRGRQPTSGYDTIIERIARQGDKVVVYTQFWEPSPWYGVASEATSPYHLVRVRRYDYMSQETELVLQSQVVTPTPPSR